MVSTKDVELAYSFEKLGDGPSSQQPIVLIVFINGLMLPRKQWAASLAQLKTLLASHSKSIYTVTYDRYGQGESRSQHPEWKPDSHDLPSAATELESILSNTLATHATELGPTPTLIFVSHSIGVPLARLHNQTTAYPAAAHLFLDSNIANTDFVSIFPDTESADFDASILPSDTTIEELRAFRASARAMFHPSVPNAEGLDRSTAPSLLPEANAPKLSGPSQNTGPYLTVVGHDPVAFAEEGLKLRGTPVSLNYKFVQPVWDAYNKGLLELGGGTEKTKGVVIAKGAGHFIQRDTPDVVAKEVVELVEKVVGNRA